MRIAAKICAVFWLVVELLYIIIYSLAGGAAGVLYSLIYIGPSFLFLIMAIANLEAGDKHVWVGIVLLFVGFIITGILYLLWDGYGKGGRIDGDLAGDSANKASGDSAEIHWICSKCGKEIRYVNHCACGHDFDPAVDQMVKKSEIVRDGKPVAGEKKACPHCGALVDVKDISCFNCGEYL